MDSIIFKGNVIGMLMYIIPALMLFLFVINGLEDRLVERKLYLACGIGVVMGTIAEVILFFSRADLYTELAYASMILVTPFIVMMFMFIGVNLKTFKDEPAAPHYSAGFGLFFGGALQFWKLLIAENQYGNMSSGDMTLITLFGLGSVVFLGGAGMWIAYAIKENGPKNGIRISGGQRQRIGIARALYREPKILILDEATSALDIDTENNILETISRLDKNLTLIIISHRMNTLKKCEKIYKIEKGKINLINNK